MLVAVSLNKINFFYRSKWQCVSRVTLIKKNSISSWKVVKIKAIERLSLLMLIPTGSHNRVGILFAISIKCLISLVSLVLSLITLRNGRDGTCHQLRKVMAYLVNGTPSAIIWEKWSLWKQFDLIELFSVQRSSSKIRQAHSTLKHHRSHLKTCLLIQQRLHQWSSFFHLVLIPSISSSNSQTWRIHHLSQFLSDKDSQEKHVRKSLKAARTETGCILQTAIFRWVSWKSLRKSLRISNKIEVKSMIISDFGFHHHLIRSSLFRFYKSALRWRLNLQRVSSQTCWDSSTTCLRINIKQLEWIISHSTRSSFIPYAGSIVSSLRERDSNN